jgi:hypothetical protein
MLDAVLVLYFCGVLNQQPFCEEADRRPVKVISVSKEDCAKAAGSEIEAWVQDPRVRARAPDGTMGVGFKCEVKS